MTAADQVENWNREFPPGTRVLFAGVQMKTRSRALLVRSVVGPGHNVAIVDVEGIPLPLDSIEPISEGDD